MTDYEAPANAHIALTIHSFGYAQSPTPASPQVKALNYATPIFPNEVNNLIYGDSISVSITVDKKGKVTSARAPGPVAPCANRRDPAVKAIRNAALDAAKANVFAPIMENGKPVEANLTVTYRFWPEGTALPYVDKKIIQGGSLNGKALKLAAPGYPSPAREARAGGKVNVHILVGEDGSIISAAPVSGHPTLLDAATEAACQSRFSPTLLSGQPVEVSGVVTYTFVS